MIKDMKLETKHLTPYLPYSLQVEYRGEVTTLDALDVEGGAFVGKNRMVSFIDLKHIKPILRPIYSMTKEEAYEFGVLLTSEVEMDYKEVGNGSKMVLMGSIYPTIMYQDKVDEDYSFMIQFSSTGIRGMDLIPYDAYEWLFNHHFDVFGLIDKGLAIEKK